MAIPKMEDGFFYVKERIRMLSKFAAPVAILLAVLGVWETSVHLLDIPRYILPAPSKIVVTLFMEHVQLLKHTLVTLEEMLLGFVLAVSIGVPLAVLMFEFPVLEKAFYPYVIGSQTVPVFAIAPLLVLWFGFGIASKVIMGTALIVFFAIVLNTLDGLKSTDPDTVNLFRILQATRWQILWKVRVPSALPFIFSGAKIGISISTIGAVIGEWVGAKAGTWISYVVCEWTARSFIGICSYFLFNTFRVGTFWTDDVAGSGAQCRGDISNNTLDTR